MKINTRRFLVSLILIVFCASALNICMLMKGNQNDQFVDWDTIKGQSVQLVDESF